MRIKDYNLPDWYLVAGETRVRTIILRDEETGEKYNLEGATAVLTVVDFVKFATDTIVHCNVDIEADSEGKYCLARLRLNPADTKDEYGKYIYQLTITDAQGHCSKPRGVLYIGHSNEDGAVEDRNETIEEIIARKQRELDELIAAYPSGS